MDRFTRKELKTDKFAVEVGNTVDFVSRHRRQVTLYGGIAVALIIAAVSFYVYRNRQQAQRQQELFEAMRIQDATIAGVTNKDAPVVTFATKEEKDTARAKAFADLVKKYPGTDEGIIARYYQGTNATDAGNLAEAEKAFQDVAASGDKEYGALAKLSLAQVYGAQGKVAEAEKLLRSLMSNPTTLVSKEQATVTLARVLAQKNPEEARKLLEPLRSERSAVSRVALTALSEIPQK